MKRHLPFVAIAPSHLLTCWPLRDELLGGGPMPIVCIFEHIFQPRIAKEAERLLKVQAQQVEAPQ